MSYTIVAHFAKLRSEYCIMPTCSLAGVTEIGYDLVQVHCCVTMMNWQGIELIAQH